MIVNFGKHKNTTDHLKIMAEVERFSLYESI